MRESNNIWQKVLQERAELSQDTHPHFQHLPCQKKVQRKIPPVATTPAKNPWKANLSRTLSSTVHSWMSNIAHQTSEELLKSNRIKQILFVWACVAVEWIYYRIQLCAKWDILLIFELEKRKHNLCRKQISKVTFSCTVILYLTQFKTENKKNCNYGMCKSNY